MGRPKNSRNKSGRRLEFSAIYCIRNIKNNKLYVGSAKDFTKRTWVHLRDLRLNKHHSSYLQRAYNKYGIESFDFCILETVKDINQLVELEQLWMNFLKPEYNILPTAYSHLGAKRTEESKKKMSLAQVKTIIYQYDLQMNLIKIHTEGVQQVSKDTGVKRSTISMGLCGKNKTAAGFIWIKKRKG